jgi:hypothetical protein
MPLNRMSGKHSDETAALISEALVRECQRWGKTANSAARVSAIKSFMLAREEWITAI